MTRSPAQIYTGGAGGFLLLQGTSTLAFRLDPALDHAFPALLAITHMIPPHSLLHIATGILALLVLARGGERGALWFAAGFGLFYIGLAVTSMLTGQPAALGLQPFDHPFHLLLGGLGVAAAGAQLYQTGRRKQAAH